MLHQSERSTVPELQDPMQHPMQPGEMVIQEERTGNQGSKIQDEMGHHHDIGLEAHNALGPTDIWQEHIFLHGGRQLRLKDD